MMFKKLALIAVFTAVFFSPTYPNHRDVESEEQMWIGFISQWKLSSRSGIWFDAHFRARESFVKQANLFAVRPGYIWHVKPDFRLAAGYCYVHFFPNDNVHSIFIPEHRPWQYAQWFFGKPGVSVMQMLRFEQRFIRKLKSASEWDDAYNFNHRVRFNTMVTIPLNKKKLEAGAWFALLNNEIFVNFGKAITYNFFDQNRAFMGAGYAISKELNFHFGYLNVFRQGASGDKYFNTHGFRMFVMFSPDFSKEKTKTEAGGGAKRK